MKAVAWIAGFLVGLSTGLGISAIRAEPELAQECLCCLLDPATGNYQAVPCEVSE